MKVEKLSISIPESAANLARKRADELAQKRGSRVTVSSYIAELLNEVKGKEKPVKQPA